MCERLPVLDHLSVHKFVFKLRVLSPRSDGPLLPRNSRCLPPRWLGVDSGLVLTPLLSTAHVGPALIQSSELIPCEHHHKLIVEKPAVKWCLLRVDPVIFPNC